MNDTSVKISTTAFARLGVRGLPNLTNNMIGGGLYVLLAETPSVRFPILATSLSNAIDDGFPCFIVLPSNPEGFLQRIEVVSILNSLELIAADRLHVFVMQEEFSKKMFRFGADAFVTELENFGIPENSYILFDQADDVLSLHDITLAMEQIDVLRNWFSKHRVTALLVFSRVTGANSSAINALMDSMNGMARLGGDEDGLKLTFDYWQSPEGTIAARSYRLSTQDSGLYEAVVHADRTSASGILENTEEVEDAKVLYFYMNPDLGSLAKQMPGEWTLIDTLVGMMHATRNTRSSTSILVYQRDTSLRQLAETVHTLRTSLGRHAKIIVQEKDASLRYQNEALLLKLGLNLVVHRDVPASRFPLMLEAMSKQVFAKDVDINFEAALASVLPTTSSGYLIPPRFIREVQAIIDRGATLDIPCAMVVGKPARNTMIIDILKTSGLSRPGDLITSDGEKCFIFLNACPESVILKTLERVFQMPVESAIQEVQFLIRNADIHATLSALGRNGNVTDYTMEIGEVVVSKFVHASQIVTSGVILQLPKEVPIHPTVVEDGPVGRVVRTDPTVLAVITKAAHASHSSVAPIGLNSSAIADHRAGMRSLIDSVATETGPAEIDLLGNLETQSNNDAATMEQSAQGTVRYAARATRSKSNGLKT